MQVTNVFQNWGPIVPERHPESEREQPRLPEDPSETVFLFGAGASVPAGVPATMAFVTEFRKSLVDVSSPLLPTLDEILTILRSKTSDVDVELLLATLAVLSEKENPDKLDFYKVEGSALTRHADVVPLLAQLREYVRLKCVVEPDNIGYLDPLREFAIQEGPLDVLTVNYDTAVEQFASLTELVCEDGLDNRWSPDRLRAHGSDIRLHKMHGSITWWKTDRGAAIRLPVLNPKDEIVLLTKERAKTLMIYPARKATFDGPFPELYIEARRKLESPRCKTLIVVGYSFRDNEIRDMVLDAARKNRELQVLLIGPNAHAIYEERLARFPAPSGRPTALVGRVVCLPYKFEELFASLRIERIPTITKAARDEMDARRAGMGSGHNLICFLGFARAENHHKTIEYLDRIPIEELELRPQQYIPALAPLISNLTYEGPDQSLAKATRVFRHLLQIMCVAGLKLELQPAGPTGWLQFRIVGRSGDVGFHQAKDCLSNALEGLQAGRRLAGKTNATLEKEIGMVLELRLALDAYGSSGQLAPSTYAKRRDGSIAKSDAALLVSLQEMGDKAISSLTDREGLAARVLITEQAALKKIIDSTLSPPPA